MEDELGNLPQIESQMFTKSLNVTGFFAAMLLLAVIAIHAHAAEKQVRTRPNRKSLTLVEVPTIKLKNEGGATEAEIKKIKGLIADLAKTDRPYFGLSPTLTGEAFAPLPMSEHFGGGLLTQHRLKRNAAFTSLVELGPKALPFLLESLDDKTPAKLTIKHHFPMGGMWYGHEIHGNPRNAHEKNVLAGVKKNTERGHLNEFTVGVGDICFVAIGQISNRAYNAVRYQPTAIIVINSTVEDQALASEVRAIWGKADSPQKLLDSLLIDFCTRGDHGYLQVGAAMRLAYYFPEATEDLIVARLKELNVTTDDVSQQMEKAGVRTEEFVKAVSWSPRPKIQAELLDMFRKTTAADILLAALPGVGKEYDDLAFQRLVEQINGLPKDDRGPFGKGYHLLIALGTRFPDRAEATFRNYLKPGTLDRRRAVIHALRKAWSPWAIKLLTPLLKDKEDTGWNYAVNPQQNEPRLPIRVCDEAAKTIALQCRTVKFVMEGSHENLDRQIEAVQQKIAEMKPPK